jgi:hypothetical protein
MADGAKFGGRIDLYKKGANTLEALTRLGQPAKTEGGVRLCRKLPP